MATDFDELVKAYTEDPKESNDVRHAQVDKYKPVPGSLSLFNPFNIFRYSRYGMNPGKYGIGLHSDSTQLDSGDSSSLGGVSTTAVVETGAGGVDIGAGTGAKLEAITNSYKKITNFRKLYIEIFNDIFKCRT